MTPHEEAVAAIGPHIIIGRADGEDVRTVEVSPNPETYFAEFESKRLRVEDLVFGCPRGDTIILHILLGHGAFQGSVEKIIAWAYFAFDKILILEHLDTCPAFKNNASVSKERLGKLREFIDKTGYAEYNLSGRNVLFVIDC